MRAIIDVNTASSRGDEARSGYFAALRSQQQVVLFLFLFWRDGLAFRQSLAELEAASATRSDLPLDRGLAELKAVNATRHLQFDRDCLPRRCVLLLFLFPVFFSLVFSFLPVLLQMLYL